MSCLDCWEWFVEFVIRCEREGSPYLKPKEPVDPSDKSQGNGSGSKRPSQVETESLSTTDTDFKKERFRQLFNKHGFNLAIFPGGNVRGVREAFNPHAVLEILPISVGEVRIRGAETGIYLAMNPNGTLYGEPSPSGDESVFIESTNGPYLVYLSKKYSHQGWYIGIKRNGDPKNGRKTWYPWGQKAVLFVHRNPYMEHHPLKQLRNRHGFTLLIEKDGKVRGSKGDFDSRSVLEFTPSNPPGAFRIRGVDSDLYLAMNAKGRLYGEKDRLNENTLFSEQSLDRFFIYLSVRWSHLGWHVGIKRSGKAKRATKTVYPKDQKAIQFEHLFPYPIPTRGGQVKAGAPLGEDFPPLAYIDEDSEI